LQDGYDRRTNILCRGQTSAASVGVIRDFPDSKTTVKKPHHDQTARIDKEKCCDNE
jgi:hypothetical protein